VTEWNRSVVVCGLALLAVVVGAEPRVGARQLRLSPGPLVRAHAALEGVGNCTKCHEAGRELSAAKCLTCHKPIADRIARKFGVHRDVGDECQSCHVEHRGVDAELRRIDPQTFNHVAETGYAFQGRHADVAAKCASCHKKRSFLDVRPVCVDCHKDVHKGTLGAECTRCHSPELAFKETRKQFDHTKARFGLTGAHRQVACEKCHVSGVFRGLHFDACSACHKGPHRHELGPSCTSCHLTTDKWETRTIDHAKTGFTLVGAHTQVACAKCHTAGVKNPLRFEQCTGCHVNVHRDSVKDDCRKCHTENSFRGAKFDHSVRTTFPLDGKHESLACRKCHTSIAAEEVPLLRKVIDFGGVSPACVGCHKDQHKGEYGRVCDACHRSATFKATGFAHPRLPEFFAGRHAGVTCVKCHVKPAEAPAARVVQATLPPRAKNPATACASCHADVHLGQVGTACERCHAIDAAKFAPARFDHESAKFKLSGKHKAVECVKCHPSETGTFPAGPGTAKRLGSISGECRTCHKDPHLGQVESACETCHSTASFRLLSYPHRGMDDFFAGFHGKLPCRSCHKTETGQFPAGKGTAIRLKVGRTCASCHPY
jgi:hypothetical protein